MAVLLILPQSILLGATFPLFAAAETRALVTGEGKGRPIATLYFANSLGGAVGVLASGFLLIPSVGLHGTVLGSATHCVRARELWELYATRALGSKGRDLALEVLHAHSHSELVRMRQ